MNLDFFNKIMKNINKFFNSVLRLSLLHKVFIIFLVLLFASYFNINYNYEYIESFDNNEKFIQKYDDDIYDKQYAHYYTFMVTKPRTPRACRKDITSGSSSTSKLAARARAFSRFRPKYTASAPASTAARICGHPPAGAKISGFTISRGPCAGPAEGVDDSPASAAAVAEPSYNDGFLRFSADASAAAARSGGTRVRRARHRARGATEAPGSAKAVELG